jgi:hypothetical protein
MKDYSTSKKARRKAAKNRKHFVPEKPYDKFPLTPSSTGMWMKKIRGKLFYFGRWGRIRNGKMERFPLGGKRLAQGLSINTKRIRMKRIRSRDRDGAFMQPTSTVAKCKPTGKRYQ